MRLKQRVPGGRLCRSKQNELRRSKTCSRPRKGGGDRRTWAQGMRGGHRGIKGHAEGTRQVHRGTRRHTESSAHRGTPQCRGDTEAQRQGCIRREGTSEAVPEAVRQAVGGGFRSGWGRLLSVTNAIEPGTWQWPGIGWAPWKGRGVPPRVTFRLVAVSLRGPGQSPVLPFACCVGSLLSVGRCGQPRTPPV